MPSRNPREFIERFEREAQLLRISAPVSRDLEITEIVDRASKGPPENNKALLFEKVNGFSIPVATSLFGSSQRLAWALGVGHLDELDLGLPPGGGGPLGGG